jgi:N-hydroxyarylamine O-acetyltransferase
MQKNQPSSSNTIVNSGTFDRKAYFDRIGFKGRLIPDLQTLTDLHIAHTQAIPFENLNPLLRLPVKLDIGSIQEKLVAKRRGGYCFEHNLLFAHTLGTIGFQVKGLAARVLWNVPEGVIPPRGHMLLLITIDGIKYIADTGFGGLTLPQPIVLEKSLEQKTSHEEFRLISSDDEFILQANVKHEWKPLYSFSLSEHLQPDYEVTNYYLSTNANSHFLHNLLAARLAPGKRYALRNCDFSIHDQNGFTEKKLLNDLDELKDVLTNVFQIELPDASIADPAFQRIMQL